MIKELSSKKLCKRIGRYVMIKTPIEVADLAFVFGTRDGVEEFADEIDRYWKRGFFPRIVIRTYEGHQPRNRFRRAQTTIISRPQRGREEVPVRILRLLLAHNMILLGPRPRVGQAARDYGEALKRPIHQRIRSPRLINASATGSRFAPSSFHRHFRE
jgi:hypothetical protein